MGKWMATGGIVLILVSAFSYWLITKQERIKNPLGEELKKIIEKPLDKYTFENLHKTKFSASQIRIGKVLKDSDTFTLYEFFYTVSGRLVNSLRDKKVSGLLSIPKRAGTYPVIVMYRGFVPKDKYFIGDGTQHTAEYFAENGFITLAPDFLGYGDSDFSSKNSIEDRFQTYPTAVIVLLSVKNLDEALSRITPVQADTDKVGIWGHSNGGQIALSVLEITSASYPTVLWNPVSKMFPYNILYFTDEFDDHGKALRRAAAQFEDDYDAEKYSLTNYFDWIDSPIELHQAEADEEVPLRWSSDLYKTLRDKGKDVTYFTYPGMNHNMTPGWETAVARSAVFYRKEFEK